MKVYLTNAFSINMLREDAKIDFQKITSGTAKQLLEDGEFIQAIGHPDTTAIVSSVLGIELEPNRATIELCPTDWLVVAQYRGPRLETGTTELPEDASIEFWLVTSDREVKYRPCNCGSAIQADLCQVNSEYCG